MRLRVPEGKEYRIHGRLYKAGEEFDAPDKDGQLWKVTGLAEEIVRRGPGRPRKIETPEMREPARYERKDMRAEDE